MRIGIVTEYFPPFIVGGAELSAYALARSLVRKGHSVDVITPNFGAMAREEKDGINIFRIPYPQKLSNGEQIRSIFAHNIFVHIHLALAIRKIAKKRGLQLLHVQNTNSIIPAFFAAKMLGIKIVVTLRDFKSLTNGSVLWLKKELKPELGYGFKTYVKNEMRFQKFFNPTAGIFSRLKSLVDILYRWPDLKLRQRCIRGADSIITVSSDLKINYAQNGFADISAKMFPVFNISPDVSELAVDERMLRKVYNIPQGKRIVMWSGRKTPAKGFDVFVDAARIVNERVDDVCFVLAGRGTFVDSSLPVIDLGMLLNSEAMKIMSISRVVAVPSKWSEPLSRVIVESLTLGVPVVAADTGGTPEMITDGENGCMVSANDARALAESIIRILSDDAFAAKLSANARESAKRMFSPEVIVDKVIEIYENNKPVNRRLPVEVVKL